MEKIYRQSNGAGIGLRGSVCLAKLVMGVIDKMWESNQYSWGMVAQLYIRYIDDLRIYMWPINPGWTWTENGWLFNKDEKDERDQLTRTMEEIRKSLDCTVNFLTFTTESEGDFTNGFLPTLDMQTRVQDNGEIMYKFFCKPMCNNIVIQFGSGLPKSIIYSSLRQQLVRRMLHCSRELEWKERLQIIEYFIQLLVNSKHSFPFIKAVCISALFGAD